jgi:hypothetical protein
VANAVEQPFHARLVFISGEKRRVTMQGSTERWQVTSRDAGLRPYEYNFKHFRTKHLLSDLQATREQRGMLPGALAPDFELPRVDGANMRLSELRGKPTPLHFGSLT